MDQHTGTSGQYAVSNATRTPSHKTWNATAHIIIVWNVNPMQGSPIIINAIPVFSKEIRGQKYLISLGVLYICIQTLYIYIYFPTSKLFNEHTKTPILQKWTRWKISNAKLGSSSIYQSHFIAADAKQVHLVWQLRFIWRHSMKLIVRYNQYLHPVI